MTMKYYKYNTIQGNLIVVPRTPFLVPQGALQAMGNSRYLKNLSLVFHNLSSHSHFQNILSQDGDEKGKLDIVGVGLIEICSAVFLLLPRPAVIHWRSPACLDSLVLL